MTVDNTSWYCAKSVKELGTKSTQFFSTALSTMVGGLLIAFSAHATEPTPTSSTTLHELAALDPTAGQLPEIEAPQIDLQSVRDIRSIIDEARKQAHVEYLAEKLRKPAKAIEQFVQLAWAEAAQRDGVEPELLLAIIEKESTFRPQVQSRYGAQGLMQVVPRWHRNKIKKSESLFDPIVNVRVGTDILEEYLEHADGNLAKALAKYSGNARGYANKVISESGKLAQVADRAAAQVAMAPDLFAVADAPTEQAG